MPTTTRLPSAVDTAVGKNEAQSKNEKLCMVATFRFMGTHAWKEAVQPCELCGMVQCLLVGHSASSLILPDRVAAQPCVITPGSCQECVRKELGGMLCNSRVTVNESWKEGAGQ